MNQSTVRFSTLISLMVTGFALLSHATPNVASEIQKNPEMKSFVGFLECRTKFRNSSRDELFKCMAPFVVEAKFRQTAFARFLLSTEVTRIRKCTDVDKKMAHGFAGLTERSVCFEYSEEGQTHQGMAFFIVVGERSRLISLYQFPQ